MYAKVLPLPRPPGRRQRDGRHRRSTARRARVPTGFRPPHRFVMSQPRRNVLRIVNQSRQHTATLPQNDRLGGHRLGCGKRPQRRRPCHRVLVGEDCPLGSPSPCLLVACVFIRHDDEPAAGMLCAASSCCCHSSASALPWRRTRSGQASRRAPSSRRQTTDGVKTPSPRPRPGGTAKEQRRRGRPLRREHHAPS